MSLSIGSIVDRIAGRPDADQRVLLAILDWMIRLAEADRAIERSLSQPQPVR